MRQLSRRCFSWGWLYCEKNHKLVEKCRKRNRAQAAHRQKMPVVDATADVAAVTTDSWTLESMRKLKKDCRQNYFMYVKWQLELQRDRFMCNVCTAVHAILKPTDMHFFVFGRVWNTLFTTTTNVKQKNMSNKHETQSKNVIRRRVRTKPLNVTWV